MPNSANTFVGRTADVFVGRVSEENTFKRMLDHPSEKWVLNVCGNAGLGKTKLIARLHNLCDGELRTNIIDFYDLDNRRKVGLIRNVSESLGLDLTSVYRAYSRANETGVASELRKAEDTVIREFERQLAHLPRDEGPLVLFFDTFDDSVQRTRVGRWFVAEFLPLVHRTGSSIAVIGGRQPLKAPKELSSQIEFAHLEKLDLSETISFFGEIGLDGLNQTEIENLWRRAGRGRPILVAILADWLTVGRAQPDYILNIPDESFESELLEVILNDIVVDERERRLLLLMAHLHHRFNADIFRKVHSPEDGELFDADPVFKKLARFSFIKYRRQVPSCLLHDEMRELVCRHIFPKLDTDGDTRSRWSQDISARYYQSKISEASDKLTKDTLQAEQLYHECFAYVNSGEFNGEILQVSGGLLPPTSTPLTVSWYRLDESWRPRNLDQMELLLRILEEAQWVLGLREMGTEEEKFRVRALSWVQEAGKGWLLVSQRRFEEARKLLESLLTEDLPERLRATALAALGESARQEGMRDEVTKHLNSALDLFTKLQVQPSVSVPLVIETEKGIPAERFHIINALGIMQRQCGELEEALEKFEQAFHLAEEMGDTEWIAAAQNNMGNVYRYQGRYNLARTNCRRAMKRRRGLGYRLDIGYSHNTLGMVYRDLGEYSSAQEHTERALRIFEEYGELDFQARALTNLGYVHYLKNNLDEADNWYTKAQRLCDQHDLKLHLPRLLSKLGLLYWDQGNLDKAEKFFRDGHREAKEQKNVLFEVVNLEYLARLEYEQGKTESARNLVGDILKRRKDYQFRISFGEAELLLGQIALDERNRKVALPHYQQAYTHFVKHNEEYMKKRLGALEDRLLEMMPEERRWFASQLRRYWEREKLGELSEAFIDTCETWES